MSFWSAMNWFAWAAAVILFVIMAVDFVRVERENSHK